MDSGIITDVEGVGQRTGLKFHFLYLLVLLPQNGLPNLCNWYELLFSAKLSSATILGLFRKLNKDL